MFKVDVMLHAPLRDHLGTNSDLRVEVMTLSLQLDTLFKQEILSHPSHKIDHGKTSSSFTDKANVVHSHLQQTLAKSHNPKPPEVFLQDSCLDRLFPRVAAYLCQPNQLSISYKKTDVDNYLCQLSALHHTLALAQQIQGDVISQPRPKYLAHQLAVLYQTISAIPSGSKSLERHRANIEENFKALKTSIAEITEDEEEELSSEVREWVTELCDSIAQVISSLPAEITQELGPLALVLQD
ncbi:uncharacterized protein LOC101847011 [Aplysia californica]|uniref:Uncharacterized protein LOC101847011 n=1 Tax=Aplysia californica TaxID=6500 RepID=A0ABM0JD24_APLCA|nr:uncharacterized protein LOC101847011 [Aplysia californica]